MYSRAIAEQGFAVIPDVIRRDEIEGLSTFLAQLPRSRAGVRHVLGNLRVARLSEDPRLVKIARDVLGRDAQAFRATLFDKSPTSNWLVVWHQDTALPLRRRHDLPGWGPWSRKEGIIYAHAPAIALEQILALRIHLDDSTASNGPLRVLPGTHKLGVLANDAIAKLASTVNPVDCLAAVGGVVAMRPLIVHASSKSLSEAPRRVLHIEYASRMNIAQPLELAMA